MNSSSQTGQPMQHEAGQREQFSTDAGSRDARIRQLEEKMQLWEMMNEAGIDEVKTLDTDLRIVTWNHMCEAVTGIASADAIGKHFLEVYPKAREWEAVVEALEQGLKGRRSFIPSDKGAYTNNHSEQHVVPLKDEQGQVQGLMIIVHDIAHRLMAENKLKALNTELNQNVRALQRANAELATFTHVTSHDLKEPLRKIYTFVELTVTEEAGKLSDKAKSNLRRVQSSVQRMGLLTDDLVMFSEISADKEAAGPLDLAEVVQEALSPLRRAVEESGATIEAGPLPTLWGPRRQFVLLFRHLLSNAVKFVAPGTLPRISVHAEMVPGTEVQHPDAIPDTQYHAIKVSDNGIGIDAEYHERIFKLFQRLHGPGEYSGTGIGLAISRKIAEQRGGWLTLESTPGGGSAFTCWIPVEAVAATRAEEEPAEASEGAAVN